LPAKDQIRMVSKATPATGGRKQPLRMIARDEDSSAAAGNLAAIGRLVGSVAHDFNNLLTGIMLCSELLAAGVAKDERLLRQVRAIQSAGQHGADLVGQLMMLARPHDGPLGRLCPNHVIAGMTGLLSRLLGENIALETRLASDLGQVEMTSAHVLQIVLNLVINARDAMPDGGRIVLDTRNATDAGASWVELSVSDTGTGIDGKIQARLFEPYFTTKKDGAGFGLGLATAQGVVEQYGGSISVESQPGCGATFRVLLPRTHEISRILKRGAS